MRPIWKRCPLNTPKKVKMQKHLRLCLFGSTNTRNLSRLFLDPRLTNMKTQQKTKNKRLGQEHLLRALKTRTHSFLAHHLLYQKATNFVLSFSGKQLTGWRKQWRRK